MGPAALNSSLLIQPYTSLIVFIKTLSISYNVRVNKVYHFLCTAQILLQIKQLLYILIIIFSLKKKKKEDSDALLLLLTI